MAVPRALSAICRHGPLCMMALWNSPFAAGMAHTTLTFPAPPDSPKMVTLCGSPPNAPMLSRTHLSAATTSSMPTLPDCANR